MPAFCAVRNCGDKYGHADNISFHKFPFKRVELLQKWLDFAQRGPDWQPSRWSAVCSRHFRDEDFNCATDRKILKKTAVPCVRLLKQLQQTENTNHPQQQNETISVGEVLEKTALQGGESREPQTAAIGEAAEEFDEEELQSAHLHSSPSVQKIKCRLCGNVSSSVVSFSTNFEIYGMIQKCFPTLNIQKDDHLPKEMCGVCLKRLENFSRFIDKVLETQSELQRKFRNEKLNSTIRATERQVKVKQEPVVRVKQEVAEGFDSFLSDDLDIGIDDGCEPDSATVTNVEQKYDFCDFPMLNAQDIINNCDIMEIINLDDPFINIPDDDANTTCENGSQTQQQQSRQLQQQQVKLPLPSAHELLQAHLLSEEHNYAYAAEDMKEEWQFKNIKYKTEKPEGDEHDDIHEFITNADQEDEVHTVYAVEQHQNVAATEHEATTSACKDKFATSLILPTDIKDANKLIADGISSTSPSAETRSTKPIVTSVSDLAETRLSLSNTLPTDTIHSDKLVVTAVNAIPAPPTGSGTDTSVNASLSSSASIKTHTKPNIVVLNESIVKSSAVFQLHSCHCCQLKFFSAESLNQHYAIAHQPQIQGQHALLDRQEQHKVYESDEQQQLQAQHHQYQQNQLSQNHQYHHQQQEQLPMVSVPGGYLWRPNTSRDEVFTNNSKLEKGMRSPTTRAVGTCKEVLTSQQANLFGQTIGFGTSNNNRNTVSTQNSSFNDAATAGAPNAVRILEMQRTFLRHQEPLSGNGNSTSNYAKIPPCNIDVAKSSNTPSNIIKPAFQLKATPTSLPAFPPPVKRSKLNVRGTARLDAFTRKINALTSQLPGSIAAEYRKLCRRYRMLQRKCKSLEVQIYEKNTPVTPSLALITHQQQQLATSRRSQRGGVIAARLCCRICHTQFISIYHLLRHKRIYSHWNSQPPKRFAATCCGCEKFFRHKVALRNHMRYICQGLPLCWFKLQMQTFKCRCCRCSTFNHWRLYRRHEIKCKAARQRKKRIGGHMGAKVKHEIVCTRNATKLAPLLPNPDTYCSALVSTATLKCKYPALLAREYACSVCTKVFATANGLNQHSITHTDQRRHKCHLCVRAFKRRNGLMQHVRGYHLQLKPHQCAVCLRSYALKSDMLRCRHAVGKRSNTRRTNEQSVPSVRQ